MGCPAYVYYTFHIQFKLKHDFLFFCFSPEPAFIILLICQSQEEIRGTLGSQWLSHDAQALSKVSL